MRGGVSIGGGGYERGGIDRGVGVSESVTIGLGGGRHWSGVAPPLSLSPRLPHGLHCHLSFLCALSAIGLVRGPKRSKSLPPQLGSGLRGQGFWALPLGLGGGGGAQFAWQAQASPHWGRASPPAVVCPGAVGTWGIWGGSGPSRRGIC